jgi:hypothetical protein
MAKPPAMRLTGEPVSDILAKITDRHRRVDAEALVVLMRQVTGEEAAVWASRIVGFGTYRYRYKSGRSGEAPLIGFAAQASQFALYLIGDYETRHATQVRQLGKYKAGKGCLYVKRLADVDVDVLRTILDRSARVRRGVDRATGER